MTRRLQHRDVTDPIDRIVRDFLNAHGVAALYHRELADPLTEHASAMVQRATDEAYELGKADAAKETK